ncbi:MAG TPA: carboxypeptidase-like regulatory domain-containing protein [Candidatus Rifleibacterium sp.]|nr:carboxypeptidase-like regulatory domain-containing protein [Candidatus Rifleibacterium sp.]HPT48040.1 carboxypeptidase-like regulatory domain-containing protein [Candidatus Rifleibacterium sp.]
MVKHQTTAKGRWLLLFVLTLASIIFTGCESGSLGIQGGTITGYVLNSNTNQPIAEVLVRGDGATASGAHENKSVYTAGDGSFVMNDLSKGTWTIFVEKYGFSLVAPAATGSDTANVQAAVVNVGNGETVTASVIKMTKTADLVKGVLKGYPIDGITGRPLTNFTITQTTPYNQRRTKTFETAADFRDTGWSGLEGGDHHYTITCANYNEYATAGAAGTGPALSIGASPVNLGVIKVMPMTINITGTLRNLPGYILDAQSRDIVVWAEAAGKVVATYTDNAVTNALKGSVAYTLTDIPVTAGTVAVKCKIRGYDVVTISSAVSVPNSLPGGTIAAIDCDFTNIEPIRRDLRVVIISTEPESTKPGTFVPGQTARVYIKQGGKDIVPYVDVVSVNYRAEAYISGAITGYDLNVVAVNMSAGYYSATSEPIKIQEDSSSAFTVTLQLK